MLKFRLVRGKFQGAKIGSIHELTENQAKSFSDLFEPIDNAIVDEEPEEVDPSKVDLPSEETTDEHPDAV